MADKKISQLTASTTPLAGTEELPVVQSGVTKKVSVANLTAGRSVATGQLTSSVTGSVEKIADFKGVNGNNYIAVYDGTGLSATFGSQSGGNPYVFGGSGKAISFYSNATLNATLGTTGNLTVSTGNLVIGTSGKGIDFSADGQAAGMTSELLDDYEEGTFTPIISGSSSAGDGTYSVQQGRYTKVGNMVFVTAVMTWSAHTGTGNMRLSGLPFTVLSVASLEPPLSIVASQVALTAGNVLVSTFRQGATYAEVLQYPTGGGGLADVPMDTAATIRYAGSFLVA